MLAAPALAENPQSIVLNGSGGWYRIPTTTLRDYKFRDVIPQQRDFSCGSAALATLLTYHYERPVSETVALKKMYEVGDKKKIEKEGFSLLDMKNYLGTLGLNAEGFRAPLDKLNEVGIPAIALINLKGYLHFVLVRGVTADKVLVADPAQGAKALDREKFEAMWNNILFVVLNDMPTGKAHFNLAKHWGQPLGVHGLSRIATGADIAPFTLHITRHPGYF
jgi:uncharacterized protein